MDLKVHVEIAAETLFKVGPVPVTNSMLTMWIVMVLILFFFWLAARKGQSIPGKFQLVAELIVDFIRGLVISTAGPRLGRRILPLILGLFIFILFSNFTGLLPGVSTVGKYEKHEAVVSTTGEPEQANEAAASSGEEHEEKVLVPYFRSPNADINMTLAMALIAIITVQIAGIRAHGVVGRIKHMADPPFLFPIELIGEVSRIISLSARLFGNVFAGEVLLGVMVAFGEALKVALIPFLFPVLFLFLEVLFGTIQAIVFALLTLIYISLAAASSHGHDDEHEEAEAHAPAVNPAVAAQGVGD